MPVSRSRGMLALLLAVFCLTIPMQITYALYPQTNVQGLQLLQAEFEERYNLRHGPVYQQLKSMTTPAWRAIHDNPNMELMGYDPQLQRPIIYVTDNYNAAVSVAVDEVWPGGESGYDLTGITGGMLDLGIWDSGIVRDTHVEFGGRALPMDGGSTSDHGTHVGGTMIAAGVNQDAKGMSYEAYLISYNWDSDDSEMTDAAEDGLTASNHSYSPLAGWSYSGGNYYWYGNPSISEVEDYSFGFYSSMAQDWDEIAYNAPYYNICKSAGNERNDGPAPGTGHYVWQGGWQWSTTTRDPDGGEDGYDCLGPRSTGKNYFMVGAVDDVINGYSGPNSVNMSSFSSWGPTDDGRIKPDIVANGVSLFSASNAGNNSYSNKSGTSMSSPNFTGSINLLIQFYKQLHDGTPPRHSTIKALVSHTADECGSHDGPDYSYGWGLLNTRRAADVINDADNLDAFITEADLVEDAEDQYYFYNVGTEPVRLTLCWTDPPGTPIPAALNDRTAMLVNDLDLRLINIDDNSTYLPYLLDPDEPSAPATTGDNIVDNVEQVYVEDLPEGAYRVEVSHKDGLWNDLDQTYSLVITGLISADDPRIPPTALEVSIEDASGAVDLQWVLNDPGDTFRHFYIYRDGVVIDSTEETDYEDILDEFGTYQYEVSALYDEGESSRVGPASITWFEPLAPRYLEGTVTPEGSVTLAWEQLRDYEVALDDGSSEMSLQFTPNTPENVGFAQRFIVPEDGQVTQVGAYLFENASVTFGNVRFAVYTTGADTTLPGEELFMSEPVLPEESGWQWLDLGSDRVELTAGDTLWAAVHWVDRGHTLLGNDTSSPSQGPGAIMVDGLNWRELYDAMMGNMLIRLQHGLPEPITGGELDGLTGFEVFRDGTSLGETTELTMNDEIESYGTYTYIVRALYEQGDVDSEPYDLVYSENSAAERSMPGEFAIGNAYPNPFNPKVTVSVQLAHDAPVKVQVYDLLGRLTATVATGRYQAGAHQFSWHAGDRAAGVYFLRIEAGPLQDMRKIVLLK
ncbi:S8 family serine peptidase [bacterium]|nr:S8 family serine peptidase [bacterium]